MIRYLLATLLVVVVTLIHPAQARQVAGIDLAETVKLEEKTYSLYLNGAGIRKKVFFKIYAAGLYLAKKSSNVDEILNMPGAKRVHMHFIYDEVGKEKLVKGWNNGFKNNLDATTLANVKQRLEIFNTFFTTVKKGDVIDLDFRPGKGTEVRLNGTLNGTVEGDDFYRALLLVWLGDKPADKSLKQGMLDAEDE